MEKCLFDGFVESFQTINMLRNKCVVSSVYQHKTIGKIDETALRIAFDTEVVGPEMMAMKE